MMRSSTAKYLLYGIVLFVFLGIIYTNIAGKKQDEILKQDFNQYQQVIQLIQNNQANQAIKPLEDLLEKYPDDYNLYYQQGMIYSGMADFEKAASYYQKAIDIRPALLQDATFTFRMGECLYHINELEIARDYLTIQEAPKDLENERKKILDSINNQLKS